MATPVDSIGEYVTVDGAAKKLNSTFWTIRGIIKRQNIPTIRVGKTLMFKLSDLQSAQANN